MVHRSNLAYVGVEFQETKARAGKTAQSWSLKSGASKEPVRRGVASMAEERRGRFNNAP